jgi:hypothetical protein
MIIRPLQREEIPLIWQIDPELFALEPEDIHLVYVILKQ